eukprot:scaffold77397_cov61-Phaeocystis_antarctica.AAC.4
MNGATGMQSRVCAIGVGPARRRCCATVPAAGFGVPERGLEIGGVILCEQDKYCGVCELPNCCRAQPTSPRRNLRQLRQI